MQKSKPAEFKISDAALRKIFTAYSVPLPDSTEGNLADTLVLFAFRGCLPVTVPDGWRKEARLRSASVDHIHMRCTLGIWNTRTRKIFVAPGSTVPYKSNVLKSAARPGRGKGKGTNQMEPGFYTDLTKGEHLQGKLNGHQALRQTAGRFYRRSLTGLPYSSRSPLYYGNPYDNLHCGWNMDPDEPKFSSAGCMVVAGLPHCRRHDAPLENQGPWKIFHDLIYAVPQKHFPLLLLPAAQAAALLGGESEGGSASVPKVADGKAPAGLRPALVFGSAGEAVKRLQAALAKKKIYRGRLTGRMDARTYRAWRKALGEA